MKLVVCKNHIGIKFWTVIWTLLKNGVILYLLNMCVIQTDILWARRRTDEISETQVPIKRIPFTFIDVGGQRTQREKWFQCFQESINTVLFFVAISEFDQTLVEDRRSNRIIESLKVTLLTVNHFSSFISMISRWRFTPFFRRTETFKRKKILNFFGI